MLRKLVMILAMISAGCTSTSGVTEKYKYDASGNILEKEVKTGGDIAAYQLSIAAKAMKAEVLTAIAKLDPEAQQYMMIRGDLWTDEYANYIQGEIAEGEQIRSGATGGIWGLVGLAGVIGMTQTLKEGQKNAGDNYTVGDINQTQSNDPFGGGEGSPGGDVPGSANINIGSGQLASDNGQTVGGMIDKNINTGFANKSTSNLDDSTQPNRINDADTVKDNKAGLGQL